MSYLGDYAEDDILDFMWSTNAADGSSVTRATNGTISVYKGNSTTQSTAGITDTEDFDSLTGIHHCRIDLSADAFYETGTDYMVVLSGATIDGESVNAVLAHFSIEYRFVIPEEDIRSAIGQENPDFDDKFALLPKAGDMAEVSDILAARNAEVIDGSITRARLERITLAIMAGLTADAHLDLPKFLGQDGTTVRVSAVIVNGNRVTVTLDGD